jgi:hypothetical protein
VGGLAGVVLVVVLVVVVLGAGSKSSPTRFRLFQTAGLTTLVPVGWTGGLQAGPSGAVVASFDDPRQPDFKLFVSARRPARGTARSRASQLRRQATTRLDYSLHYFGRILFPGGRPAWLLAYESDGFSHVVYVDTACKPSVAMTVEISAPERSELEGVAEPVAASSAPECR